MTLSFWFVVEEVRRLTMPRAPLVPIDAHRGPAQMRDAKPADQQTADDNVTWRGLDLDLSIVGSGTKNVATWATSVTG
jgi:hypothetical protein